MPQIETITLNAEDRTARDTASANKNIASTEAAAAKASAAASKAGQDGARAVVTVTDTSQKQIDKIVSNAERRLAALKSPLDRLTQQRDFSLSKVAGDPAAIQKVSSAFKELIAHEEEHSSKLKQFGPLIKGAFENPLGSAESAIEGFSEKFGTAGIVIGVVTGAIIGASVATLELVRSSGEAASATLDLSTRLGVTAEQAQVMERAATLVGVSTDGLISIQRKLADTLADGGPAQAAAVSRLEALGINVVNARGDFKDMNDILTQFSSKVGQFPDHASKVKLLTDVFGKQGLEMLPLIEKYKQVNDEAKNLAGTLSREDLEALEQANRKVKELGIQWDLLRAKLTLKIVAAVELFVDKRAFRESVVGALAGIPGIGAVAAGVAGAIDAGAFNGSGETGSAKAPVQETLVSDSQKAAVARGAPLVDAFRNRNNLTNLQAQLATEQQNAQQAAARVQKGASDTAIKEAEQTFDRANARIESLKARIKTLTELPEKEKSAHELLLRAEAEEATGLSKLRIERNNALEQYGVTKKAIGDINKAFELKNALETKAEALALRTAKAQNDQLALEGEKAAALRGLEPQSAADVEQSGNLNARKAQVAADFEARALAIRIKGIEDQTAFELDKNRTAFDAKLVDAKTFESDRANITAQGQAKIDAARIASENSTNAAVEDARVQATTQTVTKILELNRSAVEQRAQLAEQAAGFERDAQLRALDGVQAVTVQQQVAIEQQRAAITSDFEKKAADLHIASVQRQTDLEIAQLTVLYDAKLIKAEAFEKAVNAVELDGQLKADAIRAQATAAANAAEQEAAIRSAQLIRDKYQSIFDSYKSSVRGLLDDTLDKGENFFKALGTRIKDGFENAFKDMIASRTAAVLTQLTTGQQVGIQNESLGNGPLGKILGGLGLGGAKAVFGQKLEAPGHLGDVALVGGAVPVVLIGAAPAAAATVARASSGGGGFSLGGILGGLAGGGGGGGVRPGETSSTIDFGQGPVSAGSQVFGAGGFNPGVTTPPFLPDGGGASGGVLGGLLGGGGGGGGAAGGTGGGGILGQLGSFSGAKSQLTQLGNLGKAFSTAHGGVNGVAGGALLAGGGALLLDGLRRGGTAGVFESAAGGAAIGFKFGGPIGAAIGAVAGAVAGVVRLFVKTKTEKIVDRVKDIYKITITKKFASDPLQKIIDQNYGGDIEVGLRAPEVRDLLQLYAQSTEQPFQLADKPQAVSLSLTGGQLVQNAALVNGSTVAYGGGSARLAGPVDQLIVGRNPSSNGVPSSVVVQSLSLSLNGQSAAKALTGQIAESPEAVGQASLGAANLGTSRRQLAVAQSSPGLLLS